MRIKLDRNKVTQKLRDSMNRDPLPHEVENAETDSLLILEMFRDELERLSTEVEALKSKQK